MQTVNANLKLTLNTNILIENATGSTGADTLMGNLLDNILIGGPGNDTLVGLRANDTLVGEGGNDSLDGGDDDDTYLFNTTSLLDSDTVTDSTGIDLLDYSADTLGVEVKLGVAVPQIVNINHTLTLVSAASIENVTSGMGLDKLTGNTLANTLIGGAGRDSLTDSIGNDSMVGGDGDDFFIFGPPTSANETDWVHEILNNGFDRLIFTTVTTPVTVDLTVNSATAKMTTGPNTRTVNTSTNSFSDSQHIEAVFGGSANDTLTGNDGVNVLYGGPGSDLMTAGKNSDTYRFDDVPTGGPVEIDTLVELPEPGIDTLDFQGMTYAVTADLSNAITATMGTGLQLRTVMTNMPDNLEQLFGGKADDILTGNDGDNLLEGKEGNDTLTGKKGNDNYFFRDPMSTLEFDTVVEAVNEGSDVLDFSNGTALVSANLMMLTLATATGAGTVRNVETTTPANFERVFGGPGNDTLTGNAANNQLLGGGGNDVLDGDIGNDDLRGGPDNDILVGGSGADALSGDGDYDLVIAGTTTAITPAVQVTWANVNSSSSFTTTVSSLNTSTLVGNSGGTQTVLPESPAAVDTVNSAGDGKEDWLFADDSLMNGGGGIDGVTLDVGMDLLHDI